jgi:hypothetical protein
VGTLHVVGCCYRSEPLEQVHLETQLSRVLICQGRLMLRRAVVTATSRLLDYGGLVVNFGCLAAAVFGGAWSGPGQSAGDLASKVSIASFYLLTLVYNFSQVCLLSRLHLKHMLQVSFSLLVLANSSVCMRCTAVPLQYHYMVAGPCQNQSGAAAPAALLSHNSVSISGYHSLYECMCCCLSNCTCRSWTLPARWQT